ncbi:MFS transporter [Corallococcus llansteffanensis]|uniref:MFS transporter n=1 Tax=Corallococcus llansteffanensis TaxID=2316731 RepID=A0A3A8PQ68_9BACT|nr:MFS transporter [Corallococcus llansteffanensis]RKH58576.1 MFS transporter [Corallococcus llansteffanensis]
MAPAGTSALEPPLQHFPRYVLLWVAQTVSAIGTHLTGFGLGVWMYEHTKSTSLYSLIALASFAPGVLVAPLLGGVVDRHDLRKVMMLGHAGGGVCTLLIALLLYTDHLGVGAILALVAGGAAFNSIHLPAFPKATTLMVSTEQLPRANGLMQLGMALGYIVAPLLSGMLMPVIGVTGLLAIDVVTFSFSLVVLALIPMPAAPPKEAAPAGSSMGGRALQDAAVGWRYIRERPGLFGLQVLITLMSFNLGIIQVLVTPLVMSFTDVRTLGVVMTAGGLGMLAGSLVLLAWGGSRHRIWSVLGFVLLQGVFLALGATRASALMVGAGAFGVLFTIPVIMSCNQTIWQRKVPTRLQGRVFAVHSALSGGSIPVAYLLSGPLADHVFEPLMAVGGPLASTLAPWLGGMGPGRGIALLFLLLGIFTVLLVVTCTLLPSVRRVEHVLPDADPELPLGLTPQPHTGT